MGSFDITPEELFSDLIMTRAADSRLIIIVEGPSDVTVLAAHVDDSVASFVIANGKVNVMEALSLMVSHGHDGVVGVVDRDLDMRGEPDVSIFPLIWTETLDLDTLALVDDGIWNRLARALSADPNHTRDALRDRVYSMLQLPAALRIASHENALHLPLDSLPLYSNRSGVFAPMTFEEMVKVVTGRMLKSGREVPDGIEILTLRSMSVGETPNWVTAHEVHTALGYVVNVVWRGKRRVLSREVVADMVRAAIRCQDVSSSRLFDHLRKWAEMSEGQKLFRCPNCG